VRARGGAWWGGTGPGSDSSLSPIRSREGDGPDRRDPPISEGQREGRKSRPRGEDGPRRLLGRAQEEKGRRKVAWLGCVGEKKRAGWAGL
jgi:hypothetical protein